MADTFAGGEVMSKSTINPNTATFLLCEGDYMSVVEMPGGGLGTFKPYFFKFDGQIFYPKAFRREK
jgi:hypothetical protein